MSAPVVKGTLRLMLAVVATPARDTKSPAKVSTVMGPVVSRGTQYMVALRPSVAGFHPVFCPEQLEMARGISEADR